MQAITCKDGLNHAAGLHPAQYKHFMLKSKTKINEKMTSFVFGLADANDHTGCLPGQYIQVIIFDSFYK